MKKQNLKKKEIKNRGSAGITLIALVITIIVLLILAGISIAMLAGDNSILQRATDSKKATEDAQAAEEARLEEYNNVIDELVNGGANQGGTGNTANLNDMYGGLVTSSSEIANQDLFFYEIITPPQTSIKSGTKIASTTPVKLAETTPTGTAAIVGINLEYVFTQAFGNNQDEWDSLSYSTDPGENSDYINAMNSCFNKLVIPHEVTIKGKKYRITKVKNLLYPEEQTKPHPTEPNSTVRVWGTYNSATELNCLWDSPDLNVNIIFPEGITEIDEASLGCTSYTQIALPTTVSLYSSTYGSGTYSRLKKLRISVEGFNNLEPYYFNDLEELIITGTGAINSVCGNNSFLKLKSLEIKNGTTTISQSAFQGCGSLESVIIPDTVTNIQADAFFYCSSVETFSIPSTLQPTIPTGSTFSTWGVPAVSIQHRNN